MNCNSVKERLVDFLYEELPAESRAAVEEHLRSCPACKAEIAGHRSTLGSVRSALSGSLAQEPPARVRDAVMEAAKAATQARAGARPASRREPKMGFFAKLWRTPWLIPAFGAASVATAVFLVRVLKDPEIVPGQRAGSIGEQTEPAPVQAILPRPSEPHEAANPGRDTAGRAKSESPADEERLGAKFRGSTSRASRETPRWKEEDRKGASARPLGGLHLDRDDFPAGADKPSGPARADKKMDKSYGGLAEEKAVQGRLATPSRFADPPPPAAESMGGGAAVERRARSKEMTAPAGSASVLGSPVIGNTPKPAPAKRADVPDLELARPASRGATMAASPLPAAAAPAPMIAPTPPARPTMQKQAEAAREAEESYAPAAVMEEAAAEHKKGKAQPGPSLDESIRRADRLFADRRWYEAAEAYRELLRRYPGHSDTGKWRSRVDLAVFAAREVDEAGKKPAKARAADRDTLQQAKP